MTLESHGGHGYSRGDAGVDARELTRMFACNQASRIDCQFVEDIIYGVFTARSTGLRHLVDVARRIAAGTRVAAPNPASGLLMLRVHAVFVRADVVSEHTSSVAAKSVADGVPKRPGAARKCEMLSQL